jgi:hypothetical protein
MVSVTFPLGGGGGRERGGRNHMTSLIKLLWRGEGVNRQACPGFHSHLYCTVFPWFLFRLSSVLLEDLSR